MHIFFSTKNVGLYTYLFTMKGRNTLLYSSQVQYRDSN